jgi:hypothetical protein
VRRGETLSPAARLLLAHLQEPPKPAALAS